MTDRERYLDLLVGTLTKSLWVDDPRVRADRLVGKDWPDAETMVGVTRLRNVRTLCTRAIHDDVHGAFMECGTWRGGCAIMMAAVAACYTPQKITWVADSFQGCPKPNPKEYPADEGDTHHKLGFLAVSELDVRANFRRYGLMSEHHVRFIPGWFKATLPGPVEGLSVLRLDGDLYESTMQCLVALYDKVRPGGYVIIDDYGAVAGCAKAVTDFRNERGIKAPMTEIDWTGRFWQVP